MSKFSSCLEHHIQQEGLSEIQLAKVSGFSRSYVARMKNGQRISPDAEKMVRLFDALNLTAAEYRFLWDLYLEERMGEERYGLTRKMLGFLSAFGQIPRLKLRIRSEHSMPETCRVEGSEDLRCVIRAVIEREAAKPDGHLRLLLQPECAGAMEALKNPKTQDIVGNRTKTSGYCAQKTEKGVFGHSVGGMAKVQIPQDRELCQRAGGRRCRTSRMAGFAGWRRKGMWMAWTASWSRRAATPYCTV